MVTMRLPYVAFVPLLLAAMLLVFPEPVRAQDAESGFAENGPYIGFTFSHNNRIEGTDFDGRHFLRDADEVLLIPSLNDARSLGVVFGGRSGPLGGEVRFSRSKHGGEFLGAVGSVVYNVIDLELRIHMLSRKRVQPVTAAGISIPWVVAEEASAAASAFGDARYRGVGLNAGAGVAFYPIRRLGFTTIMTYRFLTFDSATGASGKSKDINGDDVIRGHNTALTSAVTVHF